MTMATLPLKAMFTFDSCVDEVAERRCASAIDTRGFRLRVGVALHADLRHGIIDARKIVWRECNAVAPMFSSRRLSLVVPRIGVIQGFCARS